MKLLWIIAGGCALILAMIGIPLPGLPTVPFLLLAALCFARGSQRYHNWLLSHPIFGPPILDWQAKGAIRRKAKIAATICVLIAFLISLMLAVPLHWLAVQALVLCGVMIFIWTRPDS